MLGRLLLALVAAVVLAACGGDDGDGRVPLPDLAGEPVCITEADPEAEDFVGLTLEAATDLAAERELEVREVGRDGECFLVTLDLRENRVNLELIGDVVVGAGIY